MTSAASAVLSGILSLSSLVPSLPQTVTNGASILGTLSAPTLSLTGLNGIISWGSDTVANTNPYIGGPISGWSRLVLPHLTHADPLNRTRPHVQL